jgi:hypothetical protein
MCVLTVAILALSLILDLLIPSMRVTDFPEAIAAVVFLALILSFSTMGLLIATRRSRNPIGWIMIVGGVALATTFLTGGYIDLSFYLPSLARPQEMLPGTQWVAWVGNWVWVPAFIPVLTFLLLLFPDGRLPSSRWRPVVWLAVAAMITVGFGQAFTPGPFADNHTEIRNPAGLSPLEGSPLDYGAVGSVLFGLSSVLSASSMAVRYHHAGGKQRQQIKWLAYAATFAALGTVASTFVYAIASMGTVQIPESLVSGLLLVQLLSYLGIPLAVGVAVLKYRLYDIGLLITNRTLVYGLLTATLAAVYFGSVRRPRPSSAPSPTNRTYPKSSLWPPPSSSPRCLLR